MKRLIGATISIFLLLGFISPTLASSERLNWGTEVNPGECAKTGKPVVNVVQNVVNDVDSGLGGYWAFDSYTRHIQLWKSTTQGEYCADVRYTGRFDGQAGQTSPGAGGTLDGNEDGAFEGGYRATITGSLDTTPGWSSRGNIGNFDYTCDLSGSCPGYVSWVTQYFDPGYAFSYDFWGWIYHGGNNGTWVNADSGNSGDIL